MYTPLKSDELLVAHSYTGLYATSDIIFKGQDLFRGLIQKTSNGAFVAY